MKFVSFLFLLTLTFWSVSDVSADDLPVENKCPLDYDLQIKNMKQEVLDLRQQLEKYQKEELPESYLIREDRLSRVLPEKMTLKEVAKIHKRALSCETRLFKFLEKIA